MIHCPHGGVVPVPEEDLPVLLPYDVDFNPDGTSPLLTHEGFMNAKCPVCGADAKPVSYTHLVAPTASSRAFSAVRTSPLAVTDQESRTPSSSWMLSLP